MPAISIGMPIYNRTDYLREAIESILNQSFKDFELLISDNASPNPLVQEICEEYERKDPRIKYFRQSTNTGAHENFKFVYENCKSKYFMWAADDDIWQSAFLERGINALSSYPKVSAWFCCFEWINSEGTTTYVQPAIPLDASSTSKRIELAREMLAHSHKAMLTYSIFRHEALREPVEYMVRNAHIANFDVPFVYIFLSRHNFMIDRNILFKKRLHDHHYIVFKRRSVLANRHFAGYWNAAPFTPFPIMTRALVPVRYTLYVIRKMGRSLEKRWRWIRSD